MDTSFLFSAFIFLVAAIAVVPIAKITGLGSVLGYLLAGILIGPNVLGLIDEPETILHFSEFGVVMMLFLVGLELMPRELWRMRNQLLGLGLGQVMITTGVIALGVILVGWNWAVALTIGLALALSSTAIALQTMGEKGLSGTPAGRSAFSILLFQDIAVIPILAIIPLLAVYADLGDPGVVQAGGHADGGHGAAATHGEPGLVTALKVFASFAGMVLAGRYLLRPAFRLIAATRMREMFTAFSLFLVVGAALLMEAIGLSPALGAFIAGVVLADSEYRHELEMDIEPFKGLLLGLFFISVGMSIQFTIIASQPFLVAALVVGLVAVKFAILFVMARVIRLHLSQAILLGALLAQGGEFAFVLSQFSVGAGALPAGLAGLLNGVVALSMAITPVMMITYERVIAPMFERLGAVPQEVRDIEGERSVIVAGFGRVGQIVGRLLHTQGFETTVIDHDPNQIELVRRFGYKIFYGDAARLDLLQTAGIADADLFVITIDDKERTSEVARLVKEHYPHVKVLARASDRRHVYELWDLALDGVERETFRSSLRMGRQALELLGFRPFHARRLAERFADHDVRMMRESHALRGDDEAFMNHARGATDSLKSLLEDDAARPYTTGSQDWRGESVKT